MAKKGIKKAVKKDKINYEVPSYLLGILSIIFGFLSSFAGLVLGIVGLVQSRKQETLLSAKARELNVLGIVISVIMLILAILISYRIINYPAY